MKKISMKVREITPKEYQCFGGLGCPAVFETDRGTLLVIGKKVVSMSKETSNLKSRIAKDEVLIEVPAGLIRGL